MAKSCGPKFKLFLEEAKVLNNCAHTKFDQLYEFEAAMAQNGWRQFDGEFLHPLHFQLPRWRR
jgi:hypothetical protein